VRLLLLLLLPSLAIAETRLEVHAGGGAEAGTIMKDGKPTLAAELGASAYYMPRSRSWGLGVILERVERREVNVDIAQEMKLDVMIRAISKSGIRFSAGIGVRELSVPGDINTPSSRVWGLDVMRMCTELELARVGRVGIDFYLSWTFGAYFGDVYNTRYGDMPYTTHEYRSLTNTYIGGVSTSMTWD
jgi:hypothetical protein